jgi:hypothetical protein
MQHTKPEYNECKLYYYNQGRFNELITVENPLLEQFR